jgi:hypothetical protein
VKYPFIFHVSNSLFLPLLGSVEDCWLLKLASLGVADGVVVVVVVVADGALGGTGDAFCVAGLGGLKCFVQLATRVELAGV